MRDLLIGCISLLNDLCFKSLLEKPARGRVRSGVAREGQDVSTDLRNSPASLRSVLKIEFEGEFAAFQEDVHHGTDSQLSDRLLDLAHGGTSSAAHPKDHVACLWTGSARSMRAKIRVTSTQAPAD